jgi:hypothetical protein
MRTTLRIPIFELRRRKATHLLPSVLAEIVSGGPKEASTAAVLTSGTGEAHGNPGADTYRSGTMAVLTSAQCLRARTLLGWNMRDLQAKSLVSERLHIATRPR